MQTILTKAMFQGIEKLLNYTICFTVPGQRSPKQQSIDDPGGMIAPVKAPKEGIAVWLP